MTPNWHRYVDPPDTGDRAPDEYDTLATFMTVAFDAAASFHRAKDPADRTRQAATFVAMLRHVAREVGGGRPPPRVDALGRSLEIAGAFRED